MEKPKSVWVNLSVTAPKFIRVQNLPANRKVEAKIEISYSNETTLYDALSSVIISFNEWNWLHVSLKKNGYSIPGLDIIDTNRKFESFLQLFGEDHTLSVEVKTSKSQYPELKSPSKYPLQKKEVGATGPKESKMEMETKVEENKNNTQKPQPQIKPEGDEIDAAINQSFSEKIPELVQKCDVLVIVPMREEWVEWKKLWKGDRVEEIWKKTGIPVWTFKCGDNVVSTCFMNDIGTTNMALFCQKVSAATNPGCVVLMGIAGRLDDDIKVGDVVVAEQVKCWMERSSVVDSVKMVNENEIETTMKIVFGGSDYRPSTKILQSIGYFPDTHPDGFNLWTDQCKNYFSENTADTSKEAIKRVSPLLRDFGNRDDAAVKPIIMASGDFVSKSTSFGQQLKQTNRNLKAIEMEAGGAMKALQQAGLENRSVMLRGISDTGDDKKKDLDAIKNGFFRKWAMHNVASFLLSYLSNVNLEEVFQT